MYKVDTAKYNQTYIQQDVVSFQSVLYQIYKLNIALLVDPGEARGCSINTVIINRPGVAGAVLQTPPSFIDSVRNTLWKYLQNIITPKPFELGT